MDTGTFSLTYMFSSRYWLTVTVDDKFVDELHRTGGMVCIYENMPIELKEYFSNFERLFRLEILKNKIPYGYFENVTLADIKISVDLNNDVETTYLMLKFDKFEVTEILKMPT